VRERKKENKLKTFFLLDKHFLSFDNIEKILLFIFFSKSTIVNSLENNFTHELAILAFRLTSRLVINEILIFSHTHIPIICHYSVENEKIVRQADFLEQKNKFSGKGTLKMSF
jgi:hypothetical protein